MSGRVLVLKLQRIALWETLGAHTGIFIWHTAIFACVKIKHTTITYYYYVLCTIWPNQYILLVFLLAVLARKEIYIV